MNCSRSKKTYGNVTGSVEDSSSSDDAADDTAGKDICDVMDSLHCCVGSVSLESRTTKRASFGKGFKKKVVRFADAAGMTLAAVKYLPEEDDFPNTRHSSCVDVDSDKGGKATCNILMGCMKRTTVTRKLSCRTGNLLFEPSKSLSFPATRNINIVSRSMSFNVPGDSQDFVNRVVKENICLEKMSVFGLTVKCLIRVANIHYEKQVMVRYSINKWASTNEIYAEYVHGSNDGLTDRFYFGLNLPFMQVGQELCFALRYRTQNQEYWDNNGGLNYGLKCIVENVECSAGDPYSWIDFA